MWVFNSLCNLETNLDWKFTNKIIMIKNGTAHENVFSALLTFSDLAAMFISGRVVGKT